MSRARGAAARALTAFRCDLRLQIRQGFHAAYAFVAITYIVLLRALSVDVRGVLLPPLLLSEAGVIGFMFAGTLLHLERGEGAMMALAVTPLRGIEYAGAKIVSLAIIAALLAVAIAGAALGPGRHLPGLAAAAALTAGFFACAGMAWAVHADTLERFAVRGGLATAVLGLPLLPYFGVAESPLWYVMPTMPLLALLDAGTRGAPAGWHDVVLAVAWLAAACSLAAREISRRAFGRMHTA